MSRSRVDYTARIAALGSDDDATPAIQEAIDHARDVAIPPGRYRITGEGLALRSGTTLWGAGRGVTTLVSAGARQVISLGGRFRVDHARVSDMTIHTDDGHALAGESLLGVRISRSQLHRLEIVQASPNHSILATDNTRLMLACLFEDITSYVLGGDRTVPAWDIWSSNVDAVTQTVWQRCTWWNHRYAPDMATAGDTQQPLFHMRSLWGTARLRNNTLRDVVMENAMGGGIRLGSVTGTLLDRVSYWDVAPGYARAPMVSLYREPTATTGCVSTTLRGISRVGDGPVRDDYDITIADAVDTTLLDSYTSGTGRPLRVDCGTSPVRTIGNHSSTVIHTAQDQETAS